jgi:3-hydroxybutyryl-CoA dehydrogenase
MMSSICICGAGTMGSGIAQVAAQSGFDTILFDLDETVLEKSKVAIHSNLQRLAQKQKFA